MGPGTAQATRFWPEPPSGVSGCAGDSLDVPHNPLGDLRSALVRLRYLPPVRGDRTITDAYSVVLSRDPPMARWSLIRAVTPGALPGSEDWAPKIQRSLIRGVTFVGASAPVAIAWQGRPDPDLPSWAWVRPPLLRLLRSPPRAVRPRAYTPPVGGSRT